MVYAKLLNIFSLENICKAFVSKKNLQFPNHQRLIGIRNTPPHSCNDYCCDKYEYLMRDMSLNYSVFKRLMEDS